MTNVASRTSQPKIFRALLVALPITITALAQSVAPPGSGANNTTAGSDPSGDNSIIKKNIEHIRFSLGASTHYYNYLPTSDEPSWVFFPPVPPALEAEPPLLPPFVSGVAAPAELAAYVGDIFYPQLAARLLADDLPRAMRLDLQAYRSDKLSLQNELRNKITSLKELLPVEQERELAAFSAAQTPRITALEEAAEKIRAGLRKTGFLGLKTGDDQWVGSKKSPTPATTNSTPATPDLNREANAIRGAAFYLEGLSAAQRRLLLEAAIELDTEANSARATELNSAAGWLLNFSPETARIRLVANLPAPLAKQISEYVTAKQALKSELRSALENEARSSVSRRTAVLKELATNQATRLEGLEIQAEEIRRDLSVLPNPPGPPAAPQLSPELTTRISLYRTHKLELLKTLYAMLTADEKNGNNAAGGTRQNNGDVTRNASRWVRDGTAQTEVSAAKLRVPPGEFNSTQLRLLNELNKEQASIREALAEHIRATNQPFDRKSINDLLKDFETSRQKQEIWDKYRDYQTAVLLPGLSPAQRRLLFSAAVEQLSLPLPAGEKIP